MADAAVAASRDVAAVFDRCAQGYDREALRVYPFVADRLIARLNPAPGSKLLDVATGTGAVALAAAQVVGPTGRVTAIDLSEGMLARLQAKLTQFGISNIDLHVMDAAALEFRRDYFHYVVCSFGLALLPDPVAVLKHWLRVARPGGAVMFTSFGAAALMPMLAHLHVALRAAGVDVPVPRLHEVSACQALLHEAGAIDVAVDTEPLGYHLRDESEWWDLVWHTELRGLCERLHPPALAALRAAHLAEVARLKSEQGLWLNVETIFARGRKPV
jgi:ubiquinone/menaquinone biosynthesis C-methylase UbiE